MAKYLLIGGHCINAGPSNVNRALIRQFDEDFDYITTDSDCSFVWLYEILKKGACAQVIVFSGEGLRKVVLLLYFFKFLRKKIIYIIHGYIRYENQINQLGLSRHYICAEDTILQRADLNVCVSKKYMGWMLEQRPDLTGKLDYVNNGITIAPRKKKNKRPYTIAVSGGNRRIKNNAAVCRAAQRLNKAGVPCKVFVFGRWYESNEDLLIFNCVEYIGHIEKKDYYNFLDDIAIFVMNSEIEPFGISLADGLNCNCSVLVSENIGAASIMSVEKTDMIHDPHNIEEIYGKIKWLFEHPNIDRLLATIDVEKCSERASYARLKCLCRKVALEEDEREKYD